MKKIEINPKLDLTFTRIIDISPRKAFEAWTKPEQIIHWFTPAPWKTVKADIELYMGGKNNIVMESPEGQKFDNVGTYLEIIPNRRLI